MEASEAGQYYREALTALAMKQSRYQRYDRFFVAAKLALFLVLVLSGIWILHSRPRDWPLLALLLVTIVGTFVVHERVLSRLKRCERLRNFNEQGLARGEDCWAGTGQSGEHLLDPAHPYARDLDLFGAGSLFELLCSARTRTGEETLAQWLLAPAPVEMIRLRQEAVRELAPRPGFREALALAGEELRAGVRPQALIDWAEKKDAWPERFSRYAAPALAAAWVASFVWWGVSGSPDLTLGISFLNYCVNWFLMRRAEPLAAAVEAVAGELQLLSAVFRLLEGEGFASSLLMQLQMEFGSGKIPASAAVQQLHRRAQWLESRHNMVVRLFQPFVFWTPVWVAAALAWREQHGREVRRWLAAAGELEALNSLACYAWEHPRNSYPELTSGTPCFDAEGLTHPLLPGSRAVANDLKLDRERQLIVLSGPNMAGKSTLLRAIGVNAVLAQAGAPVCAGRLTMTPLAVAASICVLDSLHGGLSRFYSEIKRLKQMQDISERHAGTLFLLDELLSGTNSNDRRTGTEAIVRKLLAQGAIGLVTTHDLALTQIVEGLEGRAANFHFEDRFEEGRLSFDYRMVPGIVRTANALKLMRAVGLDI